MSSNKKSLFQFAILHHKVVGTDNGKTDYETTIILEPKTVLATSAEQVGIMAAREIPEQYIDNLEEVDIVVKPF